MTRFPKVALPSARHLKDDQRYDSDFDRSLCRTEGLTTKRLV